MESVAILAIAAYAPPLAPKANGRSFRSGRCISGLCERLVADAQGGADRLRLVRVGGEHAFHLARGALIEALLRHRERADRVVFVGQVADPEVDAPTIVGSGEADARVEDGERVLVGGR